MELSELPLDIRQDISYLEVAPLRVIHPGINLYGQPDPDLITVVYRCGGVCTGEHHLLYGPKVLQFGDGCRNCGSLGKWSCLCDEYAAVGEGVLDRTRWELYAS